MSEPIYIDYSTLSTFQACKEKGRLGYHVGYTQAVEIPALSFGGAVHAGLEAYYNGDCSVDAARRGFLLHLRTLGSNLPLAIENDERRSVERGIAILEAYAHRWRNEHFENVLTPTGKKYTEIGFSIYLMDWHNRPVMYVGRIDRIMRSTLTGRLYNFETKTTTQGLTIFAKQVKPNHQVTGYHAAASSILSLDIAATVWDCIFVSSRKASTRGDEWIQKGVNIEEDFFRQETRRSVTDVNEWQQDMKDIASEYLWWCDRYDRGEVTRFPRTAPATCHTYGGCVFRDVCSMNLNQSLLNTKFVIRKWEPWKDMLKDKEA